jgi:enoyl-CoA hydratase/carnithine racemase
MPSGALVALKRLMRQGTDSGLDAALDAEAGSIARQAAHLATLERLDAFMARSRRSR